MRGTQWGTAHTVGSSMCIVYAHVCHMTHVCLVCEEAPAKILRSCGVCLPQRWVEPYPAPLCPAWARRSVTRQPTAGVLQHGGPASSAALPALRRPRAADAGGRLQGGQAPTHASPRVPDVHCHCCGLQSDQPNGPAQWMTRWSWEHSCLEGRHELICTC